jgi:tetratricopeptide (TPR) repeat protein
MLRITGHHAVSYTLAYRGELEPAVEEADAGLALFDLELERQLANTFQLSSAVAMGAARGHSLWMLGRVAEAEDQWASMLQLARDLRHPATLAAALAFALHGGFRHSYVGEMQRLAAVAEELTELAREESFFLWCAVALSYRGLIGLASGDERAGAQVQEGLELMVQTRTQLTFVMMNVLWAEGLCRLGQDEQALRRLQVAEAEMRSRQEGLCAPEIWRIRAGVLARREEWGAAEATYREALARAGGQGALSLELRAALDLYDLQLRQERPEEALSVLIDLSRRFQQGTDGIEQARAAEIVRTSMTSHSS